MKRFSYNIIVLVAMFLPQVEMILRFDLQDKNVTHMLDSLLLPTKYSKKVRPEIGGKFSYI